MLEIEIDGKKAQVADGSTVIEAAQQLGVYIPHFCYHKKLSIAANCRMCLVQVEKAPKPLPACATPVTNGMKVFTHSDLAIKAQKGVMEFLLINHPLDCPICDQGGECQLQDLAVGYGGGQSRYQEAKHVTFHKKVGPLISMEEMTRCIHCTRCVRFGQEIAGVMELGMANRSVHSEIMTFVGRTVDSELSGNMIDCCPVGALTSKPFRYSARSWELQRRRSVSPHDSIGANIVVQIKGDRVMRVLPHENEDVNECWISDKDRYSYEALNSDQRLTKPMVKQDGKWQAVEWNVALDYVSHALRDVAKNSGGDSIAALASPHSTLEEMYLLQKLMRGLGTANFDFRLRQRDFTVEGKRKGAPWLGMRLSEIKGLEAAFIVGGFPRKEQPLFAQRLRQAAKKGTKVSVLTVGSDDPLIQLHAKSVVAPSRLPENLASVVKAVASKKSIQSPLWAADVSVCAASERIAESLIAAGDKGAIFLGNVAQHHPHSGVLHAIAQELARLTGARLGFLGEAAGTVGGYIAGANGGGLNAYQMLEQPRQAYVLMGTDAERDFHNGRLARAAFEQAKTVVVLSSFRDDAALEYADVILPIAPFTETSGTFINTEGRIQGFKGVVRPLGDSRPAWKVLRVLGNLLKIGGFDYESSEEVRNEIVAKGDFVTGKLDNALGDVAITLPPVPSGLQRIGTVPIHFADPLVRRAASLQMTADAKAPVAQMATETAHLAGVTSGETVMVCQDGARVALPVEVSDCVPAGCVRVVSGHAATGALGDLFGTITLERI